MRLEEAGDDARTGKNVEDPQAVFVQAPLDLIHRVADVGKQRPLIANVGYQLLRQKCGVFSILLRSQAHFPGTLLYRKSCSHKRIGSDRLQNAFRLGIAVRPRPGMNHALLHGRSLGFFRQPGLGPRAAGPGEPHTKANEQRLRRAAGGRPRKSCIKIGSVEQTVLP